MYKFVFFDISGVCNAKCPWCITGNASVQSFTSSGFIKPEDFERAVDRLISLGLVGDDTCIELYNWGEPLLHPNFGKILEILNRKNLTFAISTNASISVDIENGLMTNMDHLIISMPGFSQESYDRIHGFKFTEVLANIDTLIENFKKAGFSGPISLAYHLYQFNAGEVEPAIEFCRQRNVLFAPRTAFIADFNVAMSYLHNTMSFETMKSLSKDLLLYYVEDMTANAPKDYSCPQYDILTIDEHCNILTCCAVPKGHPEYSIGSLFELSAEEVKKIKNTRHVCQECIDSGYAYWVHNPLVPKYLLESRGMKTD